MSIDFVALDIETANRSRGSVCSLGAVRVRDGRVVEQFATLVRPPVPGFEVMNVRVHGIRESDVAEAPDWATVHQRFTGFTGGDVVVAHNASFDSSVLRASCVAAGITATPLEFLCSLRLAEQHLALTTYKLKQVAAHLGLEPFEHHDALQDATAAARVVLALAGVAGVDSIADLLGTTAHLAPAGLTRAARRAGGRRSGPLTVGTRWHTDRRPVR